MSCPCCGYEEWEDDFVGPLYTPELEPYTPPNVQLEYRPAPLPKPRIRFVNPRHSIAYWECAGHGARASARSPEDAYKDWRHKMLRNERVGLYGRFAPDWRGYGPVNAPAG